ncbi:aldehyde dehydrogenase family protein [Nocardioides sp. QY071]|uniref:aldehyde dehydrogenase family protein n=1 Tax=Nocardioides sp. QY071 TaxID=3044187 RepID=UPI00249BED07|nr:aldehyde dehydrogenase family protein [Nocardioides sp. QY071]WGY00358.1 aldehyde dehydrogenase family protein [Nocardioides sp. QY071]
MSEYPMTVDGRPHATSDAFDVHNPATGELVGRAPAAARADLDAAMASAARAQPAWSRDEGERRRILRALAEEVRGAVDEIAPVLTAEQGKPLREARGEVLATARWCDYYADLETPVEVIQDDPQAHVEVRRRALGVVAAITPWNYPLTLAAWKIAPALAAGNTMVLKPSPYTPLSSLVLGTVMARVLPAGVLNVVTGSDELGPWMTEHAVPRKISFTGSVATGRRVALAAAGDLKRVTLEMGGNDPAILLDDVDVDAVADRLFWGAFRNSGQVCTAIKRVYAPTAIYERVVDALADRARSVRLGDGSDEASELGPVNNRPQLERVAGLVDDALAHGGLAVAGGRRRDGAGYFYEPTIVRGVEDGVRLVDEEQFGPALPVVAYDDVDDALRRANGTPFGLSASVWSDDAGRAGEVAAQIECGTAWVNTHLVLAPHQPFGGAKWSSIGVENGRWGLEQFSELQVLHTARG